MSLFQAISRSYLRWRHSKGYGVHSPFAYNLVKMAIRPGHNYGYYGYFDIDKALVSEKRHYPSLRRDARLALRLMATLKSGRLLLHPRCPGTFKEVAKALDIPCITIKDGKLSSSRKGDFILVGSDTNQENEIAACLDKGAAIMAINPSRELRDELLRFKGNGLTLTGKRIILTIPNPDMAFVSYEIKF